MAAHVLPTAGTTVDAIVKIHPVYLPLELLDLNKKRMSADATAAAAAAAAEEGEIVISISNKSRASLRM